jgi:hypothetical protein
VKFDLVQEPFKFEGWELRKKGLMSLLMQAVDVHLRTACGTDFSESTFRDDRRLMRVCSPGNFCNDVK